MALLYIIIIIAMLFFRTQARQLFEAVIKLITALSNALVNGLK